MAGWSLPDGREPGRSRSPSVSASPPPRDSRRVGVAVLDEEGHVLEATGDFPGLPAATRQQLGGGHVRWDALVPPGYGPSTSRALWKAYLERASLRLDTRGVRLSLQPLEGGERHLAVVRDLTWQHHAERMLRFLSEASRMLARKPGTARGCLPRLARVAIASVADSFQVLLLRPDGRLRSEACAHRHPEREALLRRQLPPPPLLHLAQRLSAAFAPGHSRRYVELPPVLQQRLVPSARVRSRLADWGSAPALLAVPLRCQGRMLGVLLVTPGGPDGPRGALDVATAEELGRRVTTALDNARLLRELKQAERRARFLAEASHLLAGSLEPATTLESVARMAVPMLADACAVDLQEDGVLLRRAVAHQPPERGTPARTPHGHFGLEDGQARARVLRTGQPELHPGPPEPGQERAPRHRRGPSSYLVVPLRARGHVLGTVTFLHAQSGRRYGPADLHMAMDLADRAALAADNARLYQASREAVHVRDAFLAVASHELKGPLTPFQLRLQALERETKGPRPMDEERVRAHLLVLRRQTRRLATLVDSLLDVSRVEAGTLQLDLEEVELDAVVRDVAARFEGQAARASSLLEVKPGGPLVGRWDRSRLEQVVTHLLANALKYGAGRPVHVGTAADGPWAVLTVRDEGIGIEPHALPRIFDRFERAVSEEHFGGLGLGLYLSRALVEALGGTIHATSQPGQGATFEVRLPARS
ncbi:MAG TPA: ATP-binding protein [Myxococcus sp.]|nr:ATP-binding protein [Myxococcus sp.]